MDTVYCRHHILLLARTICVLMPMYMLIGCDDGQVCSLDDNKRCLLNETVEFDSYLDTLQQVQMKITLDSSTNSISGQSTELQYSYHIPFSSSKVENTVSVTESKLIPRLTEALEKIRETDPAMGVSVVNIYDGGYTTGSTYTDLPIIGYVTFTVPVQNSVGSKIKADFMGTPIGNTFLIDSGSQVLEVSFENSMNKQILPAYYTERTTKIIYYSEDPTTNASVEADFSPIPQGQRNRFQIDNISGVATNKATLVLVVTDAILLNNYTKEVNFGDVADNMDVVTALNDVFTDAGCTTVDATVDSSVATAPKFDIAGIDDCNLRSLSLYVEGAPVSAALVNFDISLLNSAGDEFGKISFDGKAPTPPTTMVLLERIIVE